MRSTIAPALTLVAMLALTSLAACDHTEPLADSPPVTDQPFAASEPVRLTLNQGPDRYPTWLPDGSAILYSAQQLGRTDNDVCLALLPASGGTQRSLTCDLTTNGADSTNALEFPAVSPGGRLAFRLASSIAGARMPHTLRLVVTPAANPRAIESLLTVPYPVPGEASHTGVSGLHWMDEHRLVWVGETAIYPVPCERCPPDTLAMGRAITTMETGGAATPTALAGTEQATSVTPLGGDTLAFTLAGDSRVYRRAPDGTTSVLHDFGAQGIVRDVNAVGRRLAVVVGGRIQAVNDPAFGMVQWDSGGAIHVLDLTSGADVPISSPSILYRRPALSPSGQQIVTEGYALIIQAVGEVGVDTTVEQSGDLYRLGSP